MTKIFKGIFIIIVLLAFTTKVFSQDPNFHIYLCFGQSNMEGQGAIEAQDKIVDSRFKVMETVTCSNLGRTKGSWYTAVPPLTRCWSGLSPADYFGKTMVANLPANIQVGVINVSVAGCKIELFDKDIYQGFVATYDETWFKDIVASYGGNPYAYFVEVAKMAQKDGVIKGILLHQGESNTGDNLWPSKVKKIYNDLMNDLSLNPDSVPLLAGEVVHADQGGICASMNSIIARLPQSIPNSYVISSSGCTDQTDNLHFNSEGYRELGTRYAKKMLSLMGIEAVDPKEPEPIKPVYFEVECATVGTNWDILVDTAASNDRYVVVKAGFESSSKASAGIEDVVTIPFTIDTVASYNVFARLDCPTSSDDSYWVKLDDGPFKMINGLITSGWQWKKLINSNLTPGEHTLTVTYREDGAKMDKICITDSAIPPTEKGVAAENICNPTVGINSSKVLKGFALEQNYPNPFNSKTSISFQIPGETYVSLKVFSMLGEEIAELAGRAYSSGKHTVEFNTGNLSNGIYFYTIKADDFISSRKMILKVE